jgi:signal transduction histidine kinase
VWVHELSTGRISIYQAPLHDLIKKHPVYVTNALSKNLLINTTWNYGILITDIAGNIIDHITAQKGIISNYVLDTELDRFGKLWIATDYGISLISLQRAWPQLALPARPLPKTIIKSFEIDHDSTILLSAEPDPVSLTLRPKNVRIGFTTPGIEYITNHEYYVKLDDYDTAWHVAGNHSFQEYNDLPNGTYHFHVKTKIGNQETQQASIDFTIAEPWYAPWMHAWPYLVFGIAIIMLIILIAAITTYRLNTSKRILAQLVAEKTREIEMRENELKKMNQSLLEINSELDSFLYRSSHDLVSPVKSVQGLLALMKLSRTDAKLEVDYDQYFHMMEDRMKRLENILAEITDYVKSAKGEPVKTRFGLKELVDEVWSEVEFMDGADRIQCKINVDETLQIESDRDRWKMVLSNLITNAIKYQDRKKENPFIEITVTKEDHTIKVTVTDNGQGIESKYQNRLFEMFYRATDSSQGTGLGLFLVKKVVDSLKGTVQLESAYAVGTKVEITVPAAA